MIISEESRIAKRSAEDIWALWSDPTCWPTWDPDVVSVQFQGKFVAGAVGSLKPLNGPKMKWRIESADPLVSFVSTSRLPGTTVRFVHLLAAHEGGTRVTHRIEMSGWSSPLFSRLLDSKLAPSLSTAVENIACSNSSLPDRV